METCIYNSVWYMAGPQPAKILGVAEVTLAMIMTSSMCNQPWYTTVLLWSAVLPQAFLQKLVDSQKNSRSEKNH